MGFRFDTKHTNIVAYLTIRAADAPVVESGLLRKFLNALLDARVGEYLEDEPEGDRAILVSGTAGEWQRQVRDGAERSLRKLGEDRKGILAPNALAEVLSPLKPKFDRFSLYCLAPRGGRSSISAHFRRHLWRYASQSGPSALVLLPDDSRSEVAPENYGGLLPPAMRAWRKNSPPVLVAWSQRGTSVGIGRVEVAHRFLEECQRVWEEHSMFYPGSRDATSLFNRLEDELERVLLGYQEGDHLRLLHLSDLHFGKERALANQGLLLTELAERAGKVHRVMITGDMLDNPTPAALAQYQAFKQQLSLWTALDVVEVPGNHDVRYSGILFDRRVEAAAMAHQDVICDDDARVVFVCFDSTETGAVARGGILDKQLTQRSAALGAVLRRQGATGGDRDRYLRVAMVHHHPFSFGASPETFLQRVLQKLRVGDEAFLKMVNAERFLAWCADWDVAAIFHGHKHIPRYVRQPVRTRLGEEKELVAVGCGTSLGAEGLPMSYSILDWDWEHRAWSVTKLESHFGAKFLPVTISPTTHVPTHLSLP